MDVGLGQFLALVLVLGDSWVGQLPQLASIFPIQVNTPAPPLLVHTVHQVPRSRVTSPAFTSSGPAHPHSHHQGQLYSCAQGRCRVHSLDCCNRWRAEPAFLFLCPWGQLSCPPQVAGGGRHIFLNCYHCVVHEGESEGGSILSYTQDQLTCAPGSRVSSTQNPIAASGPWTKTWPLVAAQAWEWYQMASRSSMSASSSSLQICISPQYTKRSTSLLISPPCTHLP